MKITSKGIFRKVIPSREITWKGITLREITSKEMNSRRITLRGITRQVIISKRISRKVINRKVDPVKKQSGELFPLEQEIITPLHNRAVAELDEQLPSSQHAGESSEDSLPNTGAKLRVRLSLQQTHKLIELYQAYPNLWDPNHLDYHARKQRRQAWHNIAAELNDYSNGGQRYSWQMLHRKLTDYTKYYRRERQREALAEEGEGEGTRWSFYEAFSFLDDVLPISCVLQKTLQQRDSNLKIIQVYQSYEQLWCTNHPDYTKRKQRQRQLESLCTRLQEECNLQITVERLKNRLIEFRCQYRQCKEARQAALKRGEHWQSNYEYYQQLQFLELHVSPFGCNFCPTSFKRRTDFLRHQRNVHLEELEQLDEVQGHLRKRRGRASSTTAVNPLEHICHICAMKFSLRTSLLAHLRRHLGQRTHACNECPKKFFNSTALRVHQRSHTKELPYVCEHCARGFVNASKLNQHVKRHAEKRDYPCSRCDKAFYTAHERDRHTRAHLNIRDKVCPYCARAFVVGSAYYAHLNLHRGEKRYSCSNCGQRFAQYAGLYKHRKRCTVNALNEK
ncbi:zinc finger protein 286A-like [Drosophila innubila]|uniref:zinc finger protein 286A-like n=1 Tax=Drosophila innubila TaxID=198719 RepID=UPI00148C0FB0|nr:zinc finger protein 286A-like [Drosophila innubila]